MPETITEESARTVLGNEFGGVSITQPVLEEAPHVVIYDQVDGTSLRVDKIAAYDTYLRTVVAKCSACNFTSAYDSDVTRHLKQEHESAQTHVGAEPLLINGGGKSCSGCGTPFVSRPENALKHITNVIQAAPLHKDATVVVMNRFSLEPRRSPEQPVVLPVELTSDVNQKARSRSRNRRRPRHRHRGKG